MKVHPSYHYDRDVSSDSQRIKDWQNDLKRGIERDFEDREPWVSAKEHYFRRRYCQEFRYPKFPWPDSANIVLPLIDNKIDELKPAYANLLIAAHPPVTVHAADPASQRKVRDVELWFEWLIRTGSPRFLEEAIFGIDDALETGRGIYETYWHYETRKVPETLERERLPPSLRQLIVVVDEATANALYLQTNGATKPLSKREFDASEKLIRQRIQTEFDLDPEESLDQAAIESVTHWFRTGAREPLKFQKRDVVVNVPSILAINQLDFLVPSYTTDLEQTERITKIVLVTERELRAKAADGKFDKAAVTEYLDRRDRKGGHQNRQAARRTTNAASIEGTRTDREDELIELWQVCTWVATTAGAREQRAVLLCPSGEPELPLKFCLYSRDRWPFHNVPFELNKKRWYSPRGVPERLDDVDAEITEQHRHKLNRMRIANAPTFKVKPNRGVNWSAWTWQPGGALPCQHPDDVTTIDIPILDGSFDNEINQLRVWADESIGAIDYGITNPLSNTDDARTATEINAIQGKARQALSMRGFLFQRCMQGIFEDMFDLWHRYGDREVYIQVTGGGEPILLTKEQLQGRFFFQCTGTIGDSDPAMNEQRALNRLMVLAKLKAEGLVDPKWDIDIGEAMVDWMEKSDLRAMKRILRERSPQEIQQLAQQQQAMAQEAQRQQLLLAMAGQKPKTTGNPPAAAKTQLAGAGA